MAVLMTAQIPGGTKEMIDGMRPVLDDITSAKGFIVHGNGPGTLEANRFWLTGAEMTVLPEASIPVTVATPSAAKPANWISGGKTITGRAGDGKVPLRSQPTPLATFDSIAKQ